MIIKNVTSDEAIQWAAVKANVDFIIGYPDILGKSVFKYAQNVSPGSSINLYKSISGKAAIEQALGISFTGERSLLWIKSNYLLNGLGVLISSALSGIYGGIVIIVYEDNDNSTMQYDLRQFAKIMNIPILEPTHPQEGFDITLNAFRISEEYKLPVIVKITGNFLSMNDQLSIAEDEFPLLFDNPPPIKWNNIDTNSNEQLTRIHSKLKDIGLVFEQSPFNKFYGHGEYHIFATGTVFSRLIEVLGPSFEEKYLILKLSTIFPLPKIMLDHLIRESTDILVLEEKAPYFEQILQEISHKNKIFTSILGRESEHVPQTGELFKWQIEEILSEFNPDFEAKKHFFPYQEQNEEIRGQNLCIGCHIKSFLDKFNNLVNNEFFINKPIIIADPGCITYVNSQLLENISIVNTDGSAISIATGLTKTKEKRRIIAITDDTSFFQSGINTLIEAAHSQANLLIILIDNLAAPFTQFSSLIDNETLKNSTEIIPEDIIKTCNIKYMNLVDPEYIKSTEAELKNAITHNELAVLVVKNVCSLIE